MTNLVIQSFGKETEYKRAIVTILSFYSYTKLPVENTRVFLLTDQPSFFSSYLDGLPVKYLELTKEKTKEMRGAIDFLHRMKIALIEECFALIKGNMLYADSDTFFINDPNTFMGQVNESTSFMHVHEYEFEELRNMKLPAGKTFKAFLDLIESKDFTMASGEVIKLNSKHSSWNAGVMIFHHSHARFIPNVYALTDQFYPPTRNHASEQYAFSVVLQENTALQPCDSMIYHYWHRVKKEIVDEFLGTRLTSSWAGLPLQDKLIEVKNWTKQLPTVFKTHPITLKDNTIQALNENKFKEGYTWAIKAIKKGAIKDKVFVKDVLYHFKRQVLRK